MTETLRPKNADQVLDAITWALAERMSFDVVGAGSKRAFGRAVAADHVLDLTGLSGIGRYEPHELYMTARGATPLAEIEAALRQNNQQMAFEPADLGAILGGDEEAGTIGGAIACNLAGPRRIRTGAARDHLLGFHAVSGRGEVFKSGGSVVKNVTGFDLSKLIAGSMGTLGVMTEVTFKVLPAPEKTRTVLVTGLGDEDAATAMARALGSAHEVSAAAHLPPAAAGRSGVSYVSGAGGAVTAIRVEGPGPSVAHRCKALKELLGGFGAVDELHSENSGTLWREVRDVRLIEGAHLWRLSVPPMTGWRATGRILDALAGEALYDWGGGLVWLALDGGDDAAHETVRDAVAALGGHATLVRAAADVRGRVPVFQPQAAALAELTARVKDAFDPEGVLNPGRMADGV